MSRVAERQWLERASTEDPWKDGGMTLAIEDKKSGEFLGTVSLFDISKQHKRAEFGIAIHKLDNLGKDTELTLQESCSGWHFTF